MADTDIRVTLNPDGTFSYTIDGTAIDASSLKITRKSKLRWICSLELTVLFKDGRTAMANGAHVLAAEADHFTKRLEVKDLDNGTPAFKYGVAVLDTTNTIQSDDPEIIIDDGLGGGGHKKTVKAKAKAKVKVKARATATKKKKSK